MKKINRTTLFLLLTLSTSYLLAGLFRLFGGEYDQTGGTVIAVVYMFIPMASALVVEKFIHKEKIKTSLMISFRINRWFFVAWLITPVMGLGAFGIGLLFPDVTYSPEMKGMFDRFEEVLTPEKLEQMRRSMDTFPIHPFWLTLIQGLIAGITVNAVAGFGEELGWRGFLVKEMKNRSFLSASLLIGLIWGVWHAPLILMGHNYPQHPNWGVLMMILWCILLSPLFLYITIKARSVIAAAIMHGTLNATAGLSIMLIEGGNDLTVGLTGLAGFISILLVLAGIFIFDHFISKEKIMSKQISDSM